MAESIREVMTPNPIILSLDSTALEAAQLMKKEDIGNVIIGDGEVAGIVTDRDIVIRVVAEGKSPDDYRLSEFASENLITLSPDDSVGDAVKLMRDRALRRLPVVEDGKAVGIVSLGDLAVERDPDSALADISAARPNE